MASPPRYSANKDGVDQAESISLLRGDHSNGDFGVSAVTSDDDSSPIGLSYPPSRTPMNDHAGFRVVTYTYVPRLPREGQAEHVLAALGASREVS